MSARDLGMAVAVGRRVVAAERMPWLPTSDLLISWLARGRLGIDGAAIIISSALV